MDFGLTHTSTDTDTVTNAHVQRYSAFLRQNSLVFQVEFTVPTWEGVTRLSETIGVWNI